MDGTPRLRPGPFAFGMLVAVIVLLAWCPSASALDPSLDVSQYAHTSWKVREGFVAGGIFAIAQTPDGYLWLGTDFGLYRFDGARAVLWAPPPGQHLPSSFITALMVSRDGSLWIGTNKGIASWKDGQLTLYSQITGRRISSLLEDRETTIWVGEWDEPNGKLCAIRKATAECYAGFGQGALSLYEDRKGDIWAGGAGGFWHWKPGPPKFFPVGTRTGVESFAEDGDGALVIAAGSMALYRRSKIVSRQQYAFSSSRGHSSYYRLLKDQDGALWIALYDEGLLHVSEGRTDEFTVPDGLAGDAINSLFQDREGNIWVGSNDGLDRFRDFTIPTWSVRQGLPFKPGSGVLAASDGSVWTGSSAGMGRLNQGKITVYRRRREPDEPLITRGVREMIDAQLPESVLAFFQDRRQRIWVSSRQGRLGYVEGQQYHPISVAGSNTLTSLAENSGGDLWVGSREDGLFRLHEGQITQKIPWADLLRNAEEICDRLAVEPLKTGFWIACQSGGVTYFENGHVRASYSALNGLGAGVVNDLRFDSNGSLWTATETGLSRIKDGHVKTLTSKSGLPCDTVHWTMTDDVHFVWLYMSCGLVRIAQSQIDAWVSDSEHKIQTAGVWGASDGVRAAALPTGSSPQVSKAADGKIWFATLDGISVIDPNHIAVNKLPPPVHVEQVTADRKIYWQNLSGDPSSSHPKLPPLVRDLEIDYASLSLVAPEKNRFRVKLEGWDRDWQDVGNRRQAFYNNLSPGNYRFRVSASNNSGVWNEAGTFLDFSIDPAYYQTSWFRLLCVAAFLALLWALYQLRVQQAQRQFAAELEARVGERLRIARELHDTLLQSLQGLMLHFQTGIDLLPGRPVEARKTLEIAVDRADQAINEGRDAVQGLRASAVETNDLVSAIRILGEELGAADTNQNSAVFEVEVEGATRNLHPILRDEIYRIAAEAMRNAFRHAHAQRIEVEILYGERWLGLRVRDDGKGIDPKLLSGDGRAGHYGLHGMRERAQLAGGKLVVWSKLDSGTEVELSIPASTAYSASYRRRSWLSEKFSAKWENGKEAKKKS